MTEETAAPALDLKSALRKSTSKVAVEDLQKKGFKQVKVLNKATIERLIVGIVDQVIASREEAISKEERKKVLDVAQSQIETLAKQRSKVETTLLSQIESLRQQNGELEAALSVAQSGGAVQNRIVELTNSVDELTETVKEREADVERIRRRLQDRDEEIAELRNRPDVGGGTAPSLEDVLVSVFERYKPQLGSGSGGGDLSGLQGSIEAIADKINRMSVGDSDVVDKDVVLERLFSREGGEEMESNVSAVKVKEAKARSVNSTLNKLKALQQGGTKDGE